MAAAVADAEPASDPAMAPKPKCKAATATECSDAPGCTWCTSALKKTAASCVSVTKAQWLPAAIFK